MGWARADHSQSTIRHHHRCWETQNDGWRYMYIIPILGKNDKFYGGWWMVVWWAEVDMKSRPTRTGLLTYGHQKSVVFDQFLKLSLLILSVTSNTHNLPLALFFTVCALQFADAGNLSDCSTEKRKMGKRKYAGKKRRKYFLSFSLFYISHKSSIITNSIFSLLAFVV